jgi:dihydrodipicolinate synthase/N-acetylneuraminate lyase
MDAAPSRSNDYYGMMPILPTAITPDRQIDEKSMRRLVQYCLKYNAAAIGHFGVASEFHKIPDADRRLLTEIIIDETAGRVPVFIGISAQGFDAALKYADEAASLGADIIMAALPMINRPTREEAYNFYRDISDTVSLPIIIQDIPESADVLSADLACRMYKEIEHVQYVKAEGLGFMAKIQEIFTLSGGELEVIGGAGGKNMIHLLRMGITSFMTGTEALDLHSGAVQAFLAGDEQKAAEIYYQKIMPYFAFYEANSEALLKKMLHMRGIIDHPDIYGPLAAKPLSQIEWREFNWTLDRIGFKRKWPDL